MMTISARNGCRLSSGLAAGAVAVVGSCLFPPDHAYAELPPPVISELSQETGQYVSINQPPSPIRIIAGDRIALKISPDPVAGQQQSWSLLEGPTIPFGGYAALPPCPLFPQVAAANCNTLYPADFGSTAPDFYFSLPGKYKLRYGYKVSGEVATTWTEFDVAAPTATVAVTPAPASEIQVLQGSGEARLSYGVTEHGITFALQDPKQPVSGLFTWVQTINLDQIIYTKASGSVYSCSIVTNSLDYSDTSNPYPLYALAKAAYDSPDTGLTGDQELSRSFSAVMFLLWQSDDSFSVPIPVAEVFWGVSMFASFDSDTQQWSASGAPVAPTVLYENTVYPGWNSITMNSGSVGTLPCMKQSSR